MVHDNVAIAVIETLVVARCPRMRRASRREAGGAVVRYVLTCLREAWFCVVTCCDTAVSNAARLARRVITRAGGRRVRLDEGSTQRTESAAVFAPGAIAKPQRDGNHGQRSRNGTAVACASEGRFDGRVSAAARGISSAKS
jgi:hypothetical protein